MTTPRTDWLSLTNEEAIEPDLPICDPHHHFWDRPDGRYFLDELLIDTGGGHNITETVFVECSAMYRKDGPEKMRPVGETEFVQGIAAQSASGMYGDTNVAAGIVGYADLRHGDEVTEVLEAHIAASRDRFRGVRNASSWDASPEIGGYMNPPEGLLGDAGFRTGLAALQKLGLSFDAQVYHPQLNELVDLARAFPDVTIILNHTGVPLGIGPYVGRDDEVAQVWRSGITELAGCENVVMKLGGVGMPLGGHRWNERSAPPSSQELADGISSYYNFAIETLGPDRCMFESNFPVDNQSTSYTVLWNAFKRLSSDLSPTERSSLLRDTALRAYRLS
jgi:predicted TIM-barrel fold metal-dependent hydrolase